MIERIYKGATRPAMLFGIPLKAAIPVGGIGIGLAAWGGWWIGWPVFAVAGIVTAALLAMMRIVTSRDDQALAQHWMAFRLNLLQRNGSLWGKCRSYSPIAYRGRNDGWVQ